MYKEKRNFARMSFHAKAILQQGDRVIEGEVENLSMKGAFVTPVWHRGINDLVAVTIYHPLTPQVLCELMAKVVRVTDKGMGLRFEKTLLD
jgi:hypothetical protein